MAYVTPGTVAAGDVATAAAWNVLVGNDVDFRSYSNRYARAKLTSGGITANSTTWANVNTALDLTLNATTGDVIEFAISAGLSNAAVAMGFDVVSVVSAAPVNSFGMDASAPANWAAFGGPSGWYSGASNELSVAGSIFRTLVAGDISSGTVLMRLRYATAAAVNRTIFCSSVNPLEVWARNHGPVTT
jgi:hypothetical protein